MQAIRLKQMEQFILIHDFVTVEALCEKFDIHPNTARADIKKLVDIGVVQKKYGGVSSVKSFTPVSFGERQQKNAEGKAAIGKIAAGRLEEEDIIYIDSGTTVPMLLQSEVPLPKSLTIITNNLDVIIWATGFSEYTVFVLPGKLNRQLNAFAGVETIDSIKAYNIQKAFIGARGISPNGELSSSSSIDAKLKSTVVEMSKEVILMADMWKLDQTALFNFGYLNQVNYWISNGQTEQMQTLERVHKIKLLTP